MSRISLEDDGVAAFRELVAEKLRTVRKDRGLSLTEMAAASGVSRATLSYVEAGKSNPSLGLLGRLATALGVPFSTLVGDEQRASLLTRHEAQIRRSTDGALESCALTRESIAPGVEIQELHLAPHTTHAFEPYPPRTRQLVVVIRGSVRIVVRATSFTLQDGDALTFAADKQHVYQNPVNTESRCHRILVLGHR